LSAEDWKTIVSGFKDVVAEEHRRPFPQDPEEQLWGAIGAVFGSWMNPRAVTYRRLHEIPADWGTAVNVQAMVFGNMGADCGTGVSMVEDQVIDREEAVRRIEPASLDQLLHPMLDPAAKTAVLSRGLPASPGAASGKVVFSADEAESLAARGEAVILVRIETSPEDIHGMHAAKGILTTRGGMTSHAAVVARGMGRPCVPGAGDLRLDYAARTM